MTSQCSMRSSHRMHKEHWLFSFSTSLLDATKTTIFKIGKPNYRFSENLIRLPLQKKFLDKAKHPWSSSADRLRGASSGRFSHWFDTLIIHRYPFHRQKIFLSRMPWRVGIKQTNITITDSRLQIKVEEVLSFLKSNCGQHFLYRHFVIPYDLYQF